MTYREVILCFAFRTPAFFLPSVEERKELVRTLNDFGLTLTTSRIHLSSPHEATPDPAYGFRLVKTDRTP
ncbi:hypothetical protein ACWLQV_005259, partial [Escherichia coli]